MKTVYVLLIAMIMLCSCSTPKLMTIEEMLSDQSEQGYSKVYVVSYDEAFDAALKACDALALPIVETDFDYGIIIASGNKSDSKHGEHIGIYFDPYHERRTAIRVMTRSKYTAFGIMAEKEPVSWGSEVHKEIARALGLTPMKGKRGRLKRLEREAA